jgi:hypothetical protein
MKRIIVSLGLLILAFTLDVNAQIVSSQPALFTAEDQVKIIIDVRGTNVEGIEPLYIWTWGPSDPVVGNGQWGSSNEALRLTKEANNVWSITMVPVEFYGRSPGEFAAAGNRIQFLVKAKDGSGNPERKTNDLSINVEPLIFTPRLNRNFPGKVTTRDVVTLFLDQAQAEDPNLKFVTGDFSVTVTPFNAQGQALGNAITLDCTLQGSGVHYRSLIPNLLFPNAAQATSLRYQFRSKKDGSVQSSEFTLIFINP